MRIILIILIILFCIEIAGVILFTNKYAWIDNCGTFMDHLEYQLKKIYNNSYEFYFNKYIKVFGDDNNRFAVVIVGLYLTFFNIIELAVLLISNLFQLCNKRWKICRAITSLLLLLICFGYSFLLLWHSFSFKSKVDLTDEEIYIFDEEFNNEIKNNLKYIHDRRIYLITCSFFVTAAILAEFVLIIIDVKLSKDEDKKNTAGGTANTNNAIEPQVIVFQNTETQRNNLDSQMNTKQDNTNNQETIKNINIRRL